MNSHIDSLKEEISEYYIKDFEKQLGWFKSIAVLPIKKPIKDIIIGRKPIPKAFNEVEEFGWWKDIVYYISPSISNEIFEFMKDRRLEIEKRKTEAELLQLKNEIIGAQTEKNTKTEEKVEVKPETQVEQEVQIEQEPPTEETTEIEKEVEGKPETSVEQDSTTDHSSGINSIGAGVGTAVVGGALTRRLEKVAEKKIKAIEEIDPETLRTSIESVIKDAKDKEEALAHRLTTKQQNAVKKHIANLENGLANIDTESINVLKAWNDLGDNLKISRALLENCGLNDDALKIIEKFADDLAGQETIDGVKSVLKAKGITNIDDEIVESIFNLHDAAKIRQMSGILRHGNRVPRILQTLAGALRIDVAFTGLDVRMFFEQRKEAELLSKINELAGKSKNEQAWVQLGIGISSVAIEGICIWLMGSAAAGGPIGMAVGLAVGALTTAVSIGVDTLYYNVRNFYEQNQEQFLRQTRAELKQAILQGIHNKKEGDTSIHEKITTHITPRLKPGGDTKGKSLNDACASIIFLEEIGNDGEFANNPYLREYVSSNKLKDEFLTDKVNEIKSQKILDKESQDEEININEINAQEYKNQFEQIWQKMEDRIAIRMQYVKEEFEKPYIIDSLNRGTGMKDLTKLFTRSKIFADLNKTEKWDESISFEDNVLNYRNELLSEFPSDKLEKFEGLKYDNPSLFEDIINTVTLDAFIYYGEEEENNTDDNYVQNVKMVVAYKKWLSLIESVEDKTYYKNESLYNANYIENVLECDFNFEDAKCRSIEKERLINKIIARNNERYGDSDISDDIFQNVLFKIAKELNGYPGKNDLYSLMEFYKENKADVNGIYFDDKWMINNDWAIDDSAIKEIPEIIEEKDVDKYVEDFILANFYDERCDDLGNTHYIEKDIVDTDTESIDKYIIKEFRDTFERLLREELMNHTVENQNRVKEEIYNFVKKWGKGGKYLELPGYLVLDAQKAGLGDISRQYFRFKNLKIEICYLPSELNQKSIIDDCEKSFITPSRREYTQEEKYYIDRVDNAYKKLESILNKDLGLPVDLHDTIVSKEREWQNLKENILLYDGEIVKNLPGKFEGYAEYFDSMYRGILIVISGFSRSNDINNINYFNMAMSYGNQNLFDKEGNLLKVNEENGNTRNELGKQHEFINFYNQQINTLKIGDKTIKELRASQDKKEKELGFHASMLIYTTVLESALVKFDGPHPGHSSYQLQNLEIADECVNNCVYIQSRYYKYYGNNGKEVGQEQLNELIKNLESKFNEIGIAPDISDVNINNLRREQTIKKLSKEGKEATDTTSLIQSRIEKTGKDITWKGKRGDIEYDIEKSVIKSRGKEVKVGSITENTIKLKGLDLDLTLQEGVRLANFKNRLKYTYGNQEVGHTRGVKSDLNYTFYVGKTQIIERETLEKFCPSCKDHDTREKIKDWLNKKP